EYSIREVNIQLREVLNAGGSAVVTNPRSKHNLGVALEGGSVTFEGSVGYYCGGLNTGATIKVTRNAGWGIGEGMAHGHIEIAGHVGQGLGASLNGGTIIVRGDTAARAAVAQKGGDIIVGGSVGFLTGFMAQAGRLIVLGNSADALGDSLYAGNIYIAGHIGGLGLDAIVKELTAAERDEVEELIEANGFPLIKRDWKKVVAGQKLWHFDKREADAWLKI
ncbi:MAG: glutamate synthase, partial [Chloroflexi bacterium]|nr:glutamate synthase [Chloroflexota bacterium]